VRRAETPRGCKRTIHATASCAGVKSKLTTENTENTEKDKRRKESGIDNQLVSFTFSFSVFSVLSVVIFCSCEM
jgi:hypothetical protein